jgi:6-phosphogluconolactonase
MAQTPPGHLKHFELKTFVNSTELAQTVAGLWLDTVEQSRRQNIAHTVAFSGGRIAAEFFVKAAIKSITREISFAHVDFFWGDERCVPPDDPESNFLLANHLLAAQRIPPEKVHRLRGEIEPAIAVAEANVEILKAISQRKNGMPVLDIVFLGVGSDGHVASLFPNASLDVAGCQSPFLFIENSPKPPPSRITLSYTAIAAAKEVWVLVSGDGKERILTESLTYCGQTPLARVLQSRTQTKIFTDLKLNDAAGL